MSDIISTSNGQISFRREDYKAHQVGGSILIGNTGLCIWTKPGTPYEGGMIFTFKTQDVAIKYSKEIIEQLSKPVESKVFCECTDISDENGSDVNGNCANCGRKR